MDANISKHPNLRIFRQHGFNPAGMSGTKQVYGRCIFCGHEKNMFINLESKAWDCKSCGKSGGFKILLKEISTHFIQFFKGTEAIWLSKDRGIGLEVLRENKVGYNPINHSYLVPIYDMSGEGIWDVKIFKEKKLSISAGCLTGLYGWEVLNTLSNLDVWLCEGEWDTLALKEIFKKNGIKNQIIVGTPGANTFKAEWVNLFNGRKVNVLYDNDKAGKEGSQKVYKLLKPMTKELRFLSWSQELKEGYDVRDLWKETKDAKKAFKIIQDGLKNLPLGDPKITEEGEVAQTIYSGKGLLPKELYEVYDKWLTLKNHYVIDILMAIFIGNRWDGDMLWLFLVAPSGGIKTEMLVSFDDSPNVSTHSDITPQALVSGMSSSAGGSDPSLLPKLDGKIWIIKDFTVVLTRPEIEREAMFSIFRDAYDQKFERSYGNGVVRRYKSKFGIIAGVTPIIEMYTEGLTSLGERFLSYDVPHEETWAGQRVIATRALLNEGSEIPMRAELKEAAKTALDYDFGSPPALSRELVERIVYVAQWLAILRATVIRDKFTKEILHHALVEMPTRISKQFSKLCKALAAWHRKPIATLEEYERIKDVAVSSAPSRLEFIIRKMYLKKDKVMTMSQLCIFAGLPEPVTKRLVENLVMLKALSRVIVDNKPQFRLTKDMLEIMDKAELYKQEK